MTQQAQRLGALALAMGLGAGAAAAACAAWGLAAGGAAAGGILGALAWCALDTAGLHRLAIWLRDPTAPPPASLGQPWGELVDRAVRAMTRVQEQTRAEAHRRHQFVTAIDSSPNGVLLLSATGEMEWFNAAAASHLGLEPARDQGQRLTHLVRAPAIVDYLRQPDPRPVTTATAPDGRTRLSLQARPAGDGLTLLITQDVTERERTDAMRRDFVANVSHELRSPLTVLCGFLETLQTLPLVTREREHVVRLMQQQASRMQSLVTDLLALAQIEGAPKPALDRWICVHTWFQQMEADAHALDQGRHDIRFDPGPASEIAGAETELFSAAWNLLANAIRHTPAGCTVQARWALRSDGRGVLTVSDDGAGIAREHLPRLTERFYRVDPSRSRETGGTGLGLAIVKHVVQRHDGDLQVESVPGHGACFSIALPASRVRLAARTALSLA
jgi:two-component system phosphate regulon sensor histidine kinase PhoR